MENAFDALHTEKRELDLLLDKGVNFTTPRLSIFSRLRHANERVWILRQPYLGTLDYLSREFIEMDFSEERLQADALGESRRLTAQNVRRCSRVVAIALLNNPWKIKLLTGLLSRYLLWRITPAKLFELTLLISTMSNVGDFTNSIRLMHVQRTTAPGLIEQPAGA